MPSKISSSQLESLVLAADIPTPIPLQTELSMPINPMAFPHDWSIECRLDTRWLTDVTQSLDQHEDRWALANKPARTLQARIVGASKIESDAILQSALGGATQFGFPVPIYPDGVAISNITVVDSTKRRIHGDFRYRRFFRGGRVVFLPFEVDPDQAEESASYAEIIEVTPDEILIDLNQGTIRDPAITEVVFPCMDVEIVESASGTALTDSVLTVELEWNEVDGESSLPSTWPATSVDQPTVLEPLCSVIDGRGVFPFNPDWSQEVSIDVRRLIDSDNQGRTNVQEASGEPFLEFVLSVMGYDRPSCWRAARFFDAHRGRAASFWLEHPMKPFSSTGLSATSATIEARGNTVVTAKHVKHLIFSGANGTQEIRKIDSVSYISGEMVFAWTEPLTITSVSEFQPVYVCRFDQDSLTESWNTDTVQPSMEMRIVEEPQLSGDVTIGSVGFVTPLTNYTELGNCNLLLKAGANCFDGYSRPSHPFPGSVNITRIWKDSSVPYDIDGVPARPQMTFSSPTNATRLYLPYPRGRNNGQPILSNPYMEGTTMLDSSLPIKDRQLWDAENGWTVFFVAPAWKLTSTGNRVLFDFGNTGEFGVSLVFDSDGLATGFTSYITAGPWASLQNLELIETGADTQLPTIFAIRFGGANNGNSLHVWANGKQALSSAGTVSLVDVTDFDFSEICVGYPVIASNSSAFIAAWEAGFPAISMVLSYAEALDQSVIQTVHTRLVDHYFANSDTPTLY